MEFQFLAQTIGKSNFIFPQFSYHLLQEKKEFVNLIFCLVRWDKFKFGPQINCQGQTDNKQDAAVDNLQVAQTACKRLLSRASDTNGTKEPIKEAVEWPKDMAIEESEESSDRVLGCELVPEAVEEVRGRGVRRGWHGLEIGPGRLLDEAVPDGDFRARVEVILGGRLSFGRIESRRGGQ